MNGPFKLGDTNKYIVNIQRALNEKLNLQLKRDGNLGAISIGALKTFQTNCGLVPDGIYAGKTAEILDQFIASRYLKSQDFKDAGALLQCDPKAVYAVMKVETSGEGFFTNGSTAILFERHQFKKYLDKKMASDIAFTEKLGNQIGVQFPQDSKDFAKRSLVQYFLSKRYASIYNPVAGGYTKTEYDRFNLAASLDQECAMFACSWGLFQIMGFNHEAAGYTSVQSMVSDFAASERIHLLGFSNFIKSDKNLLTAIRLRKWSDFALHYNGPNYKNVLTPPYDVRMANEFNSAVI